MNTKMNECQHKVVKARSKCVSSEERPRSPEQHFKGSPYFNSSPKVAHLGDRVGAALGAADARDPWRARRPLTCEPAVRALAVVVGNPSVTRRKEERDATRAGLDELGLDARHVAHRHGALGFAIWGAHHHHHGVRYRVSHRERPK